MRKLLKKSEEKIIRQAINRVSTLDAVDYADAIEIWASADEVMKQAVRQAYIDRKAVYK